MSASIASWANPVAAAPASGLEAAEAQLESGQYAEAAASLGQYYESLAPELKASQTGEFIVMRAADAYDQAFNADGAVSHLENSKALLDGFIATVGADAPLAVRPKERLASVEERLSAEDNDADWGYAAVEVPDDTNDDASNEGDATDETDDAGSDPPASDPPRDVPVEDNLPRSGPDGDGDADAPTERDRLGLGLTIGGAAGIVVGASLIGWGLAYESRAEQNIDDRGGTSEGDDDYLQDAQRVRNGLLIPGVVIATLGTGALILGAVRLARARRKGTTAWHIAPGASPRFAGIVIGGRLPSRAHR